MAMTLSTATYEYQVIPAPRKGKKARGVKGADGRFANAMQDVLNEAAAEGWEYLRADTLPSEERSGLTGRNTVYQNMLVFRRQLDVALPMEMTGDAASVPAPLTDTPSSEPEAQSHARSLPSAQDANLTNGTAPEITHTASEREAE